VRGGDLKYSDAERKAVLRGGVLRRVVAETADATTRADEVDLILLPAGNHAGAGSGTGQVDRMTAQGNVSIDSETRRGTGEKLEYSSERAEYVLTGTAANPPRMTDPTRGTVTGESLIFNSRDDSVNVEGGQHATTTETTAPKQP
jgi:lipopolysaccharide export system protein LptA